MASTSFLIPPPAPPPSAPPLVIVGASTRAAAWSAIRAGRRPLCADLFADRDLLAVAVAIAVEDYPLGLVKAVEELLSSGPDASCPAIYTGAMENHFEVVAALSDRGPLLGNPPETLRLVSDPGWIAQQCDDHNLSCPAIRPADDPPPRGHQWLLRQPLSAGGSGVSEWNGTAPPPGSNAVFQERIRGRSAAALCLGTGSAARVLGVTEQLVGREWLSASRWAWCGSIGPLELPPPLNDQVAELADAVAAGAGLVGLFGIDLVLDGQRAWIIEINPRYTGSAEVIEMSTGQSMIGLHLDAFGDSRSSPPLVAPDTGSAVSAKAVLFAREDITVTHLPPGDSTWSLADIPHSGARITKGRPICSILARGVTADGCRDILKRSSEEVYRAVKSSRIVERPPEAG